MENLNRYIQKKDMVEFVALLVIMVATVVIRFVYSGITLPMTLLAAYFIFLLVYLIKQFEKYTVLNRWGKISTGMFVFSLYVKTYVAGPMMAFVLAFHYVMGEKMLKLTLAWNAIVLLAYFITIVCKKEKREIFNTVIYFIPLIVLCFISFIIF